MTGRVQLEIMKLSFSFHDQLQWNILLLQWESRILAKSWIYSIPLHYDSRRSYECHQKSTLQNSLLFSRPDEQRMEQDTCHEKLPGKMTRCLVQCFTNQTYRHRFKLFGICCAHNLLDDFGYFQGFRKAEVLSIPTASPCIPIFMTELLDNFDFYAAIPSKLPRAWCKVPSCPAQVKG